MSGTWLLCMFMLCGVHFDMVSGSLHEFFKNFGDKISESWHYTWNNIVEIIKKPVKIRRLGSLGKLKSTSPPSTLSTSPIDQMYTKIEKNTTVKTNKPRLQKDQHPTHKLTDSITEKREHDLEREIMGTQDLDTELRNARLTKLLIPHLKPPQWTGIDDWRSMNRPIYRGYHDNTDGVDKDEVDRSINHRSYKGSKVVTSAASGDENEIFGILIFA